MANVVNPLTMVTLAGAGPVPVRNPNGKRFYCHLMWLRTGTGPAPANG